MITLVTFGEKKVGEQDNKEKLKEAIQTLAEVAANPSTPKMIKKSVTDMVIGLKSDEYSKSVRAANAISVLDDITQDPNIPSYVRVTLWQAVSNLCTIFSIISESVNQNRIIVASSLELNDLKQLLTMPESLPLIVLHFLYCPLFSHQTELV